MTEAVKNIQNLRFELESNQEKFINYLSTQGPNRYIGKTAYTTINALNDLDSTVWHVRSYCKYMGDLGDSEATLDMHEAAVTAASNQSHKLHYHKFNIFNGYLEKVLGSSKDHPARKALVWANLFYGAKKRTKVTFPTFSSSEIPPTERGWSNVDWKEIKNYVRL